MNGNDNGMEHKAVGVAGFKILDEETGVVETVVSVTGIVDRVKDDILPGAYEKTLQARTPKGVWSHDWEVPVSKTLHAEELHPGDARLPQTTAKGDPWPSGAGGLLIRTQFNLETQRGREAFSDVKFYGAEQEWSVGYKVPLGKSSVDKKTGVRNIEEMDLYEYSPVLFGAMPLATTVSVKELTEAVTHELRDDLESMMSEFDGVKRDFSQKERDKASNTGAAMPDGSFPIKSTSDLKNAIAALGRAKNPDAAKAHIIKRAKALGATDLLPKDWGGKSAIFAAQAAAQAAQGGHGGGGGWSSDEHPRDEGGKWAEKHDYVAGKDGLCAKCGQAPKHDNHMPMTAEKADNPDDIAPHDFTDDGTGKCKKCGLTKTKCEAMYKPEEKAVPADTYGKPGYSGQGRPTLDPGGSVEGQKPVPDGSGDTTSRRVESDTGVGKPGFDTNIGAGSVQSPGVEGQKPAPSGAGQGSGSVSDDSQTAQATPGPGGSPAQGDVQSPGIEGQKPAPDGQGDQPGGPTRDAAQTQHQFSAGPDGTCKVCGNDENFWLHFGFSRGPRGDAPVTPNGGSVPADTYGKPGGKSIAEAFLIALDDDEIADLEAAIAERKADGSVQTTHKFKPGAGGYDAPCSVCGRGQNSDLHFGYSTADPEPSGKAGMTCSTCGAAITKAADGRYHHASGDDGKDHQAKPGTKDELAELDEKIGRMLSGSNAKKVQAAWSALREVLSAAGVDLGDAPVAAATNGNGKSDLRVIEPGEEVGEAIISESELMELATLRAASS